MSTPSNEARDLSELSRLFLGTDLIRNEKENQLKYLSVSGERPGFTNWGGT